ncbi:MAG TPA: hypothetical protein VGD98_22555 [Ktedonobacteraceae bacterium]
MVKKKQLRAAETPCVAEERELTESELADILGGTGGSLNLPLMPNWFASPNKGTKAKAGANQLADNFSTLTGLTNGLMGTLF